MPKCSKRTVNAFTVVELLVVIAVMVILLTVSLPSLLSTKATATDVATLSHLRQHGAIFAMYTNDYDDFYPALTETTRTLGVWKNLGRYRWQTSYFRIYHHWHIGLADQYYDGRIWGTEFLLPGAEARTPEQFVSKTHYWYSSSFLADPEFWNASTRTGPDQWRATRWFEVIHPSKKTLLLANGGQSWDIRDTSLRMSFVDGASRIVEPNEFLGAYENGDGSWPQSAFGYPGVIGMHTIDGVRGRDVQ